MRHQVAGKKLSRDRKQRKALFKNLIGALVLKGEIKTTESKAKAIRRLVERLIAKGRGGTLHARRQIGAFLQNKEAVNKIVDELGPIFKNRPGGFTRIVRLGQRRGDNTSMVKLELVEKPVIKEKKKEEVAEKPKVKGKKIKNEDKGNKRK